MHESPVEICSLDCTVSDSLLPLADTAIRQINQFFPQTPRRLQLLRTGPGAEFKDYPHSELGLPREAEILESLEDEEIEGDYKKCVEWWVFQYEGKVGVREKVEDVLERLASKKKGVKGELGKL